MEIRDGILDDGKTIYCIYMIDGDDTLFIYRESYGRWFVGDVPHKASEDETMELTPLIINKDHIIKIEIFGDVPQDESINKEESK